MAITDDQLHIIMRSHVDAADEDYIVARWACLNRFEKAYLWHGQQAVEKYLKAAMLALGYNPGKTHGVAPLLSQLAPRFSPELGDTIVSEYQTHPSEKKEFSTSLHDCILSYDIHADIRYGVLSSALDGSHLARLDFTMIRLRKLLRSKTPLGRLYDDRSPRGWENEASIFPQDWILHKDLRLEQELQGALNSAARETRGTSSQRSLVTENAQIWSGIPIDDRFSGASYRGSPIAALCTAQMRLAILRNEPDPNALTRDQDNLEWALRNIPMWSHHKSHLKSYFDSIREEFLTLQDMNGPT